MREEEVADFLLRNKFFLTALEFHQELQEDQRTDPLPTSLQSAFGVLPDKDSFDDLDSYFSQGTRHMSTFFIQYER